MHQSADVMRVRHRARIKIGLMGKILSNALESEPCLSWMSEQLKLLNCVAILVITLIVWQGHPKGVVNVQ